MVGGRKKKPRSKSGSVPNELIIHSTKGIRLEDINIGDRVSYIHPSGGGQHIADVIHISDKGIIHTEDWVKEHFNIKIENVRGIWKREAEEWIRQPLYQEEGL